MEKVFNNKSKANAIIWSAIEKFSTYFVNLAITLYLARLLCPTDYAVVAVLSVFFSISQAIIDSGFSTAIIQNQNTNNKDISTVFFFNIFIAILLYIVLFIFAPYIEHFYGYKELAKVTRFYLLSLIISSLGMMHRVILIKALQFKRIAIITFFSTIVSSILAILFAYFGFKYWALVIQNLTNSLVTTILLWFSSKWRPQSYFSINSLKKYFSYGSKILMVSLERAIYTNIYSMLIGKFYSAKELGLYDRGKSISSMGAVGFSDFFSRAIFPIFSKEQNDKHQLLKTFYQSIRIICLFIAPVSAFLCFFSYDTIHILIGDQWLESAPILSILSIGFMFYPLTALNYEILKSVGQSKQLLKADILKTIIGIICLVFTLRYKIQTVAIGWTISAFLEYVFSVFYAYKSIHFSLKKTCLIQVKFILPALVIAYCIQLFSGSMFPNPVFRFFAEGFMTVVVVSLINYKSIKNMIIKYVTH